MSSMMSSGGRQDPPGQPAFGSDYLSGEGDWSAINAHCVYYITLDTSKASSFVHTVFQKCRLTCDTKNLDSSLIKTFKASQFITLFTFAVDVCQCLQVTVAPVFLLPSVPVIKHRLCPLKVEKSPAPSQSKSVKAVAMRWTGDA